MTGALVSVAGSGSARLGMASPGTAGQSRLGLAWLGSRGESGRGLAWPGAAWQSRLGTASWRAAQRGVAVEARRGLAGLCWVGPGGAVEAVREQHGAAVREQRV